MSTAPRCTPRPEHGPFLVASSPSAPRRYSPLVLWHLLSLDAPTVAAVWTAFIAWSAGVRIAWTDPLAMFLAVWVLYAADRLLDAKPLFAAPNAPQLEERHHFHHRHRRRFVRIIAAGALPLALLLHRTDDAVLHLYILLASLLGIWLLLIHARPAPSAVAHRLPKELAVGLFFPAAVFIPVVSRAPALRAALAPLALLFACVCTLNCLFLYAWEHPRDRNDAHRTTRWAVRHLEALALAAALLALGSFFLSVSRTSSVRSQGLGIVPHFAAVCLACSLSGGALLALHASRRRLQPLTLRSLADLMLLTPLPIMLVLRSTRL